MRTQFIQLLVLDSICDDFENIDQCILQEVAEIGAKCGLTIGRGDVVDALRSLVEDGFAKAYDMTRCERGPFSGLIEGMPDVEVEEEWFRTYFFITDKGRDFHRADDTWWPFDDDEVLRPDWIPPRDE